MIKLKDIIKYNTSTKDLKYKTYDFDSLTNSKKQILIIRLLMRLVDKVFIILALLMTICEIILCFQNKFSYGCIGYILELLLTILALRYIDNKIN